MLLFYPERTYTERFARGIDLPKTHSFPSDRAAKPPCRTGNLILEGLRPSKPPSILTYGKSYFGGSATLQTSLYPDMMTRRDSCHHFIARGVLCANHR